MELKTFWSDKRQWNEVNNAFAGYGCGWIATPNGIHTGKTLVKYFIDRIVSGDAVSEIFSSVDGNFGFACQVRDRIYIAGDLSRSTPIFYKQISPFEIIVSDDIQKLAGRLSKDVDRYSLLEMATSGYVTGHNTLYQGVKGLLPGQIVVWDEQNTQAKSIRYFEYKNSYSFQEDINDKLDGLDEALSESFSVIIESLNGHQAIVPLSGGLDSTLVAVMLKKLGYDNVLCISYGVPGNKDSKKSEETAEKLGLRWMMVPYHRDDHQRRAYSSEFKSFAEFSFNGVAVPHIDDWIALNKLKELKEVDTRSIILPGHTGDFISGEHLKYVDGLFGDSSFRNIHGSIVKKHYSLWTNILNRKGVFDTIKTRIDEVIESFEVKDEKSLAAAYEYWEWQERQSKYIVNSVRSYEYFEYEWRLPLWRRPLVDFWMRVSLADKQNQSLYIQYLLSHDPDGVFDNILGPFLNTDNSRLAQHSAFRRFAKNLVYGLPVLRAAMERRATCRLFNYQYRNHPLGMPQEYGWPRYVFRDPKKRHHLSLFVKDYMKDWLGYSLKDVTDLIASCDVYQN